MGVNIVRHLNGIITLESSVVPKGAYASGTIYVAGEAVSYLGSSYAAIQPTQGNLPTNTTYWMLLAEKGVDGDTIDVESLEEKAPPSQDDWVVGIDDATGATVKFNVKYFQQYFEASSQEEEDLIFATYYRDGFPIRVIRTDIQDGTIITASSALDTTISGGNVTVRPIIATNSSALDTTISGGDVTLEGVINTESSVLDTTISGGNVTVRPIIATASSALDTTIAGGDVTVGGGSDLTSGLLAYLKMDDSSGNATDSAGTGVIGVNTDVTYTAGKVNNCAVFNGSSAFLSIEDGAGSIPLQAEGTVSMWMNMNSLGDQIFLFNRRNDGTTMNGAFQLQFNGDGRIGMLVMYNEAWAVNTNSGSNVVTTGSWFHFLWKWGSFGHIIKINGTEFINTASTASVFTDEQNFLIGAYRSLNTPIFFMDGKIDALAVWSRSLTSGEEATLYNSGNGYQF